MTELGRRLLFVKAQLYERRASLERILELKRRTGQDVSGVLDSIEHNERDIDLFEGRGPERSWEEEAAINAGFIAVNGL